MQENDFSLTFRRGDLIVLRAGQTLSQFSQLVIMRREQSLGRVLR